MKNEGGKKNCIWRAQPYVRVVLCLKKTEFFFDSITRFSNSELKRLAWLMWSLKYNRIQKQTPRVVVEKKCVLT